MMCNIISSHLKDTITYSSIPDEVWECLTVHNNHSTLVCESQWMCCSQVVDMLMKHGDIELCRQLFDKYPPNNVHMKYLKECGYPVLMASCCDDIY
jgi:hypothetical protein